MNNKDFGSKLCLLTYNCSVLLLSKLWFANPGQIPLSLVFFGFLIWIKWIECWWSIERQRRNWCSCCAEHRHSCATACAIAIAMKKSREALLRRRTTTTTTEAKTASGYALLFLLWTLIFLLSLWISRGHGYTPTPTGK